MATGTTSDSVHAPTATAQTGGLEMRVRELEDQLRAVQAISTALGSPGGLDIIFREMVPQVSRLMEAERTTLFLYDFEKHEIWSKVAQGAEMHEFRLPVGAGIAGWVAEHREPVSIPDAYTDERFQKGWDQKTGFRTRSVAAVPMRDRQGELLGVLQVLNRRGEGVFGPEDVGLLGAIAHQAAYAVENARLYDQLLTRNRELEYARQRAEERRAELDLLFQLEQESSASIDLDELLDSIIKRTCDRLRSRAGSVLLTEHETGRLFFRGVAGDKKDELKKIILERGQGLVGWVAESGEPVIVAAPEDDLRHFDGLAKQLEYPAKAILAVPLVWDGRIIGAVEVLDPVARASGRAGYDLEDLKVLTVIAGQLARIVVAAQERAERLTNERLALMGRMLASVAHDLRNPMTVISGYAQLMAMDEDAAQRNERAEKVLRQVDEMTSMVNDLLAFARGDSRLRPAHIDTRALGKEVEEYLEMHCGRRRIQYACNVTPGMVFVDLSRAKRVLLNLTKNAVDVLRPNDSLTVKIAPLDGGLEMSVADTVPGLPPEVRQHLFQPFATAGKEGGTGLGLSIVKRFVDDHAGTIDVESNPERGTTFNIRLPRAASTRPENAS